MGHLSITETPIPPKITGEVQLLGGRFGNATKLTQIEGRLRFAGYDGQIESLKLGGKETDASFYGHVDYWDSMQITMRLFPNQRILDLSGAYLGRVSHIEFVAVAQVPPTQDVAELELRGGIG